jgi:hypothetical protein
MAGSTTGLDAVTQPTAGGAGYPTGTGPLGRYGGVTLRGVDPSQLVTNRLADLLRSDNPLLQGARGRAMNYAAARGAGVDGASYGYNAETAMGNELAPLAQNEADTINSIYAGNQDALNRALLEREGNTNAAHIASMNNSSAMQRLREQNAYDQRSREQNRQWQVADQGTQARAAARSQFFGNMESALFSDPSFWRDPQGMMGAFNEYGSNFDAFFNSAFPEYAQGIADAGQSTGGAP